MDASGVARRAFGVYPVVVSTPLPWAMLAVSRLTPPMRTGLSGKRWAKNHKVFGMFHGISKKHSGFICIIRYLYYL